MPTETSAFTPILPGKFIEALLLGVPAIGLLYAGYWLHVAEFTPDQLSYIGTIAIAGALVATFLSVLVLAVFAINQFSTRGVFFLLISTGTEGALLGVFVGMFAVSDRLRREGEELTAENLQFQYLERIADIGYWELRPMQEPPYPVMATDGIHRILDLDAGESINVHAVLERIHPDDRPDLEAAIDAAINDGDQWDLEVRLLAGTDTTRWVHSAGEPLITERGRVESVRGVIQDITDRKQHELELERQNERLGEFAGLVSHDIRNPLNVATGRLELAREKVDNEHLVAVERAHERIQTLIEDLLDVAREGEGTSELQPVQLMEVVQECWANVETSGATLELESAQTILAEEGRLRQLLENLIRNAAEHGGESVTVHVGELDDGFYVEDDGVGIPGAEREKIFVAGYSSSSDETSFGLSIVKQVVDAHGWDIRAIEGRDGGVRFEITGVRHA